MRRRAAGRRGIARLFKALCRAGACKPIAMGATVARFAAGRATGTHRDGAFA